VVSISKFGDRWSRFRNSEIGSFCQSWGSPWSPWWSTWTWQLRGRQGSFRQWRVCWFETPFWDWLKQN
jgi:hypothetical protein